MISDDGLWATLHLGLVRCRICDGDVRQIVLILKPFHPGIPAHSLTISFRVSSRRCSTDPDPFNDLNSEFLQITSCEPIEDEAPCAAHIEVQPAR